MVHSHQAKKTNTRTNAHVEPELKQAYVELCPQRGGAYSVPNTTTLHDAPSLWEYRDYDITVRTVPDTQPLMVLDVYWTPKTPANFAHCVTMPGRRLPLDKCLVLALPRLLRSQQLVYLPPPPRARTA